MTRIDPQAPGADIIMMKTPDAWPHAWPGFLPLKRGGAPYDELGVMTAMADDDRWTVWRVSMFDVRLKRYLLTGDPGDMPREDFTDAEGVFDAGWRVN